MFRYFTAMSSEALEKTKARERLVEAAGEVFAEKGFHAATVREITKHAGVNIAAINYYFRDKDELYSAVLRHAHQAATCLAPILPEAGPPEERLYMFIHGLLIRFLDPRRPAWQGKLMARELASPTRMFEQLIDEGIRPKCQILDEILEKLTGAAISSKKRQYIAGSIMGQCLFYRQNRHVIHRLYPDLIIEENSIENLATHITEFSLAAIRDLTKTAKNHERKLQHA